MIVCVSAFVRFIRASVHLSAHYTYVYVPFQIFTASAQLSMPGHRFVPNVLLEGTQRTRRYIICRMWGACDTGGASYGHRKPPKLALLGGVPIPGKLEQVFPRFVVLRGILYVTVCCVLQTYKQLRCTFGPSHVFSNEKASERTVSNV